MTKTTFTGPILVGPAGTTNIIANNGIEIVSGDLLLDNGSVVQPNKVSVTQSTIVASTGATNTATITITLKDGAGNALTTSVPFEVYASSAADGLTVASAASTGFSVASGGLKNPQGNTAITQGIRALSSATGTCVLSLLDTSKTTSYLVLVVDGRTKISAQLTTGNYG